MEKLLKLLNEYKIELHWVDRTYKDGFDLAYEQEYMRDFRVAYLISKSFWFIKRLIQNDKIDTFRILDKRFDTQKLYEREHYHTVNEWNTDLLLMLLAISENPIEDLISYLK